MKNKVMIWVVMILQALPIPISLITILGSIISLANIGVMIEQSMFVTVVATIFMILAGTYSLTYLFSAIKTFSKKRISFISFLPIVHIVVTVVFMVLWIINEQQNIDKTGNLFCSKLPVCYLGMSMGIALCLQQRNFYSLLANFLMRSSPLTRSFYNV